MDFFDILSNVSLFFVLGGLFDFFSGGDKKTTNTTNTTNVDNTRTTTLTDSLNTWLNQNTQYTNATSNVYNYAFDAVDSFNSVNNFNLANIGSGVPKIPTLDFTGLRSLFTSPEELAALLNANEIDKDPNANKYDFNFSDTAGSGNDFLAAVAGAVRDGWTGMVNSTNAFGKASGSASETSSLLKWVVIFAGIVLAAVIFNRRRA